ncbi:MAG: hypothetical protein JJU11_10780 [Candidatus Sumerlaeia bacterium]|nr:hypothetical protein [Candidatus Sumerlaeia bacterium]
MVYDEWLVCRVTTSSDGACIHAVMQNLTAYISAARLLDRRERLAPDVRQRIEDICVFHERVLRSYLITRNITESRDLIRRDVSAQAC